MELEDFYTGEIKDIEVPRGCIIIDKNIEEANQFFCHENFAFWNAYMDILFVDFFPNKPKSVTDIPLYKSDKEGCFRVIVKEDKYKEWIKQQRRKKQNEIKRQQNIAKQQAIFDKKGHLRLEGDTFRKDSKIQQAIDAYNLALHVEYKIVNKWFKLYCIDEDLQSLDGLIAIFHKLNDFEKERECLERAISLASLNSRHEKRLSKYKHKLEILLGTYKEKEIPPESHMNVVYTDLINDCDVYKRSSQPYVIKNGRVVYDKLGKKREKVRDCLDKLMRQGQIADNEFDYKTAVDIYERLIAEGYDGLYVKSIYDRLITIYFNYKLYEDEVRIIKLAIEAIRPYHNKRLEQLEKRLVSAQKRVDKQKMEKRDE